MGSPILTVYYDAASDNQVEAYHDFISDAAWPGMTEIEVTDPDRKAEIRSNGRNCQLTVVDGAVTAVTPAEHPVDCSLDNKKAVKIAAVDTQSGVLIVGLGLSYDSVVFSLSPSAQLNWTNLWMNKANWAYPVKISLKDSVEEYELAAEADVEAFYEAAVNRIKAILDSGRTLKKNMDDAADQTALDAINDTRS